MASTEYEASLRWGFFCMMNFFLFSLLRPFRNMVHIGHQLNTRGIQMDALFTAYNALVLAGDFNTTSDPRAWVRLSNILFDACLDAGMSYDEPDHEKWAALTVTKCLLAA